MGHVISEHEAEVFVSEPMTPEAGSFDASGIARGEPGLAARFTWRGKRHAVVEVLSVWKTSSPEGGSGEVYLRRHWWAVRTDRGLVLKVYCERQSKSGRKRRWHVYTMRPA